MFLLRRLCQQHAVGPERQLVHDGEDGNVEKGGVRINGCDKGDPHKSDVPEDQGRPEDPLSVSPQPEHPFDDGRDDDENDVQSDGDRHDHQAVHQALPGSAGDGIDEDVGRKGYLYDQL